MFTRSRWGHYRILPLISRTSMLGGLSSLSADLINPVDLEKVAIKGTALCADVTRNPLRLVFSCCFACFFFVQRFGIHHPLLRATVCVSRVSLKLRTPHARVRWTHRDLRPATLIMRGPIR